MNALALALSISGTLVELVPTDVDGAVAEVRINNVQMNGPADDGIYWLALDELMVGVIFTWEADEFGSDQIEVIPPDGIICEPRDCIALTPEGHKRRVVLFPWIGG